MRRRGVLVSGAAICDEILRDVEAVFDSELARPLTLREAASVSGYSEDHLGKLIRQGRLTNVGRKGSPRVRAGELPRRPGATTPGRGGGYDPQTDAARLLAERSTSQSSGRQRP